MAYVILYSTLAKNSKRFVFKTDFDPIFARDSQHIEWFCIISFSAKYTRLHNDANVLCMGGRVVSAGLAEMMVDLFLDTEFEGGRHQRRIDKISEIENN